MTPRIYFIGWMLALIVIAGCAKTKVTNRDQLVTEQLPRPAHIWVQDFAATPAELPPDSMLAGQYPTEESSQTAEEIETGRRLGAQISTELVAQIRAMGLPAEHVVTGTTLQLNDILLRGYLISFDEGDAKKRVTIGMGKGSSELKVAVEGFQVTTQGLRKLGAGATASGSSKTPGAAVGAVTLLATKNPAGLIVSTGMKVYGEKSGSSKVEGRAKQTGKEIAEILERRFKELGWIK